MVYKADAFDYELGDEERIKHKPHLGEERGAPVAVYAIARTKDGAVYREVMSVGEVEKIRRASKAANAGPWVDHWGEMARKTVIKRLAKRLPSSADLDQVIASDNEVAGFATQDAPAAPVAAPAALPAAEAVATQVRTTSRLKRSIAKAAAVEEPVVQETTQAEEPATPAQEEVADDAAAIPHF